MDRGIWGHKESDTTERLNNNNNYKLSSVSWEIQNMIFKIPTGSLREIR